MLNEWEKMQQMGKFLQLNDTPPFNPRMATHPVKDSKLSESSVPKRSAQVAISKEVEFDPGHRVPNHKSKCRSPHGHRYRVRVTCSGHIVSSPGSSDEGMLVDFSDLKSIMVESIHDVLDHSFIVYEHDKVMLETFQSADTESWKHVIFGYIPTAENIALWCWEQLEPRLTARFNREDLELRKVEVWETPTSVAIYEGR
jgi:6-pyruvoyltetrahydropterin/6-carboxytetrahydropterin synthase